MTTLWMTETGVRRHRYDASREGRSICGRRIRYGALPVHDQYELCGQCERLNRLASSELDTRTGDVLAEHDAERVIPVRGGPALDPQTEFEYTRERET